jgi:hypothetical protein
MLMPTLLCDQRVRKPQPGPSQAKTYTALQAKAQHCAQRVMIGRKGFLKFFPRKGEKAGKFDCLYSRHDNSSGSMRMILLISAVWAMKHGQCGLARIF